MSRISEVPESVRGCVRTKLQTQQPNHIGRAGTKFAEEPDFVRDREASEVTKSATEPSRQVESAFLEEEMDAFLGIHTCGRLAYQEDRLHYPYEPTPYVVLEALWKSGQVGPDNCLVDYGCGKGRVVFYGAGVMGCRAIGVERDRHLYGLALENLASFKEKESSGPLCPLTQGEGGKDPSQRISFFHGGAEEYLPPPGADRFFFFNPFSQVILARVLDKLLDSYYACPRDMRILYYYGDKELSCYLASRRDLSLKEELDVSAYFSKGKDREKILVFHIG